MSSIRLVLGLLAISLVTGGAAPLVSPAPAPATAPHAASIHS